MRFKDLIAECTYSYENLHVDETTFNCGGLTAIIGRNKDQQTANGAGKTNILKIIYYLLFGKELNKESVEEISNRVLDRGHFGQLIFEDKGNEFKIQRYREFKPNKNSLVQGTPGSKARLKGIRFFINGERFGDKKPNGEPTSDTEIQNIILGRIGMTPELFLMSVMTAQDSETNFLMSADTKKKEIISELLTLDVYEDAYEEIKTDIEAQEKQIGQAEMQVDEINRETTSKDAEIENLKVKEQAHQREMEKELEGVQERFLKAEGEYRTVKKNKPEILDQEKIEKELKSKELELEAVPKDTTTLETEEIKVLEEQTTECESTLRSIEAEASRVSGQLQFIANEAKKKTSTKESIESQIESLKKLLPKDITSGELEALPKEIQSANERAVAIENNLAAKSSALQLVESNSARISGQIHLLEADFSKKGLSKESIGIQLESLILLVTEKSDLAKDALLLNEVADHSSLKLTQLTRQKNEFEFKSNQFDTEISGLLSDENCPTCERPWDKEHQSERDAKVNALKAEKKSLQTKISLTQTEITETEKVKNSALTAVKVLGLKTELENVTLAETKIETLKAQESELGLDIKKAKEEVLKLNESMAKEMELVRVKTEKIEALKAGISAQEEIAFLDVELNTMKESEELVKGLTQENLDFSKRAAKVRQVLNTLAKRKTAELDRIRLQIRVSQETVTRLNQEIKSLNGKLSEAKLATQALAQWEANVASAFDKLDSLTKQAEQVNSRPNPYKELMEKVEERKLELKGRKDMIKIRIEKVQAELRYLYFWKNGFGPTGIRSFISDEVVVNLNELVRDYMNDLFDGAISVVFESESISGKGGVSNKISTKFFLNGKSSPMGLLSGGERQRVVLAVDLALSDIAESRTGTKINLKFMDEPFNGIDSAGQLKSIALFAKIANRKSGFFIITHDEKFQVLCNHTIYVVLENEISHVVTREKFRAAG